MQLPRVASSISVPPLPGASEQQAGSEPGGEWELLVSKWQTWWSSGELIALASQARNPLLLLAGLFQPNLQPRTLRVRPGRSTNRA
jgi:hypothetical protein